MTITRLRTKRELECDEAVTLLEELLTEAKEGKIRSVAVAVVNGPGQAETAWSGTEEIERMAAAVNLLQFRYMEALNGDLSEDGED